MFRIIIALVLALALAGPAYADQKQYADALYEEAFDLFKKARDTADSRTRLALLRETRAILKQLVDQYPSSDHAANVKAGFMNHSMPWQEIEDAIWQTGWSLCPQRLNRACVLEFALTTAEFAEARAARDGVLMGILDAYVSAGNFEAAKKTGEVIRYVTFWPSARERIAKAQAAAGDVEAGLATALEIQKAEERAEALAGVIEASGRPENAKVYRAAVDAALAASERVDYLHILPQTLQRIAEAQATAGKFDDALATAAQIGESAAAFREKLGFTLARIAQLQAEAGDIASAKATLQKTLEVVERTTDKRPYEGILLQVMDAQITLADVKGVRMTVERLGDRDRLIGLIGMYRVSVRAHDDDSAKTMLDSALQLAEATRETTERTDNLGGIASLMAKAGDVESAHRVFEKALGAAAGIDDAREHAVALWRLALAMKAAGDEESAKKTIEPLRELIASNGDARKNPILLASMAGNLAQLGEVTSAMGLAAQIGDIDQRTRALVEIAATLPN